MSFNTYPYSPFPASTEQLHKGDNEDLQAQIDAIKDSTAIDSFGDVETALATKTDNAIIAPEFDAEAGVYSVGDLVMYEGTLYEFTTAHETAGEWNSEEVTEKTVADEVDTLKSGLISVDISSSMTFETGITVYKSVIRKVASMVSFSFQLGIPSSASSILIGTITGNRPQSDIVFSGMAYTGTDGDELPCLLNVDPAGQFTVSRTNSKGYAVVSGSYAV